jgi:transcriptional regulator with XRE-family HTH domain
MLLGMAKGRPLKTPEGAIPAWASRIAEARERKGFSQQKLADQIGASQATVGGWERGRHEPDIATFNRIGSHLDVTGAWLAYGVGDPDQENALALTVTERHENDKLFAFAFSQVASLFADEGFKADLGYLTRYTMKLLRQAKGSQSDRDAQDAIRQAIETERAEIRAEMDEMRKKRL